jgi:integrase
LKTEKGQRLLTVPPVVVEALRKHRQQQNEERLQAGDRWTNSGLVFTTYRMTKPGKGKELKVGAPLHPRNVTRIWDQLLTDAGVPKRGIHHLRHSAASFLIAAGTELVEVSQLLGHTDVRTTANLYGHLLPKTAKKAATHMDTLFPAKAQQS